MPQHFSGNHRKIIVSKKEVLTFMRMFPCSGLSGNRSYWFEFDKDGNLVDTDVPEHDDGDGARVLADDCHSFLMHETIPDWAD